MKAEHRKELETNLLADRLGRFVQGVKGGPRRLSLMSVFLIALAVVVVGLGGFIAYRVWVTGSHQEVFKWAALELGRQDQMNKLATDEKQDLDNPSKAARLQIGRLALWDAGVHRLGFGDRFEGAGANAAQALKQIDTAKGIYEGLEKQCEKDDEWMSEIKYSLAVIEEVRALQNISHLESARTQFEDVASKFPDTGFGKLAENHAKVLKDNVKELTELYQDLGRQLNVPPEPNQNVPPAPLGPLAPAKGSK